MCLSCVIQLEEEEGKDSFDVDVAVTNPEKVGQSLFYFILSLFVKTIKQLCNIMDIMLLTSSCWVTFSLNTRNKLVLMVYKIGNYNC